jgi:hypothetical protein
MGRVRNTTPRIQAVRDAIIEAVESDAPVSVRGVFYRVVSMGEVTKDKTGYILVQHQLLKMRQEGLIPYPSITDGGRGLAKPASWGSLSELLDHYAGGTRYKRELWPAQGCEVIITTEKDAIVGVIESVTEKWDVQVGSLHGFSSETFLWELGEHINDSEIDEFYIYHFGDLDPSGLCVHQNLQRAIDDFVGDEKVVHVKWAGITFDQIDEFNIPTDIVPLNPAGLQHYPTFREEYGDSVYEVDAIPPNELRGIIEDLILGHIDQDILNQTELAEQAERTRLARFAKSARKSL